jgi:LPS O-antigen subunit length determinant protein (WzzB/FepE family)
LKNRKSDDFTDKSIREVETQIGQEARQRQIEMLDTRKNDLAFITNQINPLKDELEELRNLRVDFSDMPMIRLDQYAFVPEKPIKPNVLFILIGVVLVVGFLSVVLALVVLSYKV